MTEFRIYLGWDPRDDLAYKVAEASLRAHASMPVKVIKLKESELRRQGLYWRTYHVDREGQMWDDADGKPFSTQFSFTRFLPPVMEQYDNGYVLFVDADMMFRGDIAELVGLLDEDKAAMCVKHAHVPNEAIKMDGVKQTQYRRKNWSSVLAYNCWKNKALTKYKVNNADGSWLHGLSWLQDEEIGELPKTWNHLVGYDDPDADPKLVHFTLGTPDMEFREASKWDDEWRSYV